MVEIKGIQAQLASFPKALSLGRPAMSTNIVYHHHHHSVSNAFSTLTVIILFIVYLKFFISFSLYLQFISERDFVFK